MNVEEIIDNVAEIVQEDFSTPSIWSRSEILSYINSGQKELVRLTMMIERFFIQTISDGKAVYDLPKENTAPKYVAFNNDEIHKAHTRELDVFDTDWENTTGTPGYFYQQNLSLNQIGVYPTPDTDGSEVIFSSNFGVARNIQINSVLQTFDSGLGVVRKVDYTIDGDKSEVYFSPGGAGDPSHSNPFGRVNDMDWSRGNLTVISKSAPDIIDTENDKLTINPGLDFVVRDYSIFQSFFREGDGRNIGKALHFKERFNNLSKLLKSYHMGS